MQYLASLPPSPRTAQRMKDDADWAKTGLQDLIDNGMSPTADNLPAIYYAIMADAALAQQSAATKQPKRWERVVPDADAVVDAESVDLSEVNDSATVSVDDEGPVVDSDAGNAIVCEGNQLMPSHFKRLLQAAPHLVGGINVSKLPGNAYIMGVDTSVLEPELKQCDHRWFVERISDDDSDSDRDQGQQQVRKSAVTRPPRHTKAPTGSAVKDGVERPKAKGGKRVSTVSADSCSVYDDDAVSLPGSVTADSPRPHASNPQRSRKPLRKSQLEGWI